MDPLEAIMGMPCSCNGVTKEGRGSDQEANEILDVLPQ